MFADMENFATEQNFEKLGEKIENSGRNWPAIKANSVSIGVEVELAHRLLNPKWPTWSGNGRWDLDS